MFTIQNFFEALNRIRQLNIFTGKTGKLFCDVKWLRQESLHFTRTVDKHFLIFRQLVHTKNGNNIL